MLTCTELIIVLRANTVAQSRTVDSLSKAPCVSMSNTATWTTRGEKNQVHRTVHTITLHGML